MELLQGSVLQLGYEKFEHLPLCSFGPGGAYIVDWEIRHNDLADPRRIFPPRTLGSVVRRLAGWMLWDLQQWLIATHPGRKFRADSHPAALEPCDACGHQSLWPRWFTLGLESAPILSEIDENTLKNSKNTLRNDAKACKNGSKSIQNESVLVSPDTLETVTNDPRKAAETDAATRHPDSLEPVPENYPFPHNFKGSKDLEPVQKFYQSPAGRLIARLSAESGDPGTLRLFADDDLVPSGGDTTQATANTGVTTEGGAATLAPPPPT